MLSFYKAPSGGSYSVGDFMIPASYLPVLGEDELTFEKAGSKAAASRAVNAKDYLVTEKGIDASRISVYTGSQDGQTVSSTIIPTGATLDQTGLTAVDESAVKVVPRTPAKKKKK